MENGDTPGIVPLIKDAVEAIREGFKKADDDWIPVLVVTTPSGVKVSPIPISADKEATAKALTWYLADLGATEAAMVASSWMIVREGVQNEQDFLPVSEQPDRQEVLILAHVTSDSVDMEMAEIFRDGVNPPKLSDWAPAEQGGPFVTGLFADAMRAGIERARVKWAFG